MVAVSVPVRSLSYNNKKAVTVGLLALISGVLMSCASTQDLYAQYDEQFCPVEVRPVADSGIATQPQVVERVVVKEVPASGAPTLVWEPAIYFKSDSAKLTTYARDSLDTNVTLLKRFPRHLVSIRGFTDAHSSVEYNRELAQKRIADVKRYLTKKGIKGSRIVGTSHGESIPLAANQSAIADNINRRVELLLLDSNGRPVPSRQPLVLGPSEG